MARISYIIGGTAFDDRPIPCENVPKMLRHLVLILAVKITFRRVDANLDPPIIQLTMTTVKIHALYNDLPSIEAAHAAFTARTILSQLHDVFANYHGFAVCLVHRHTALKDGELMVEDGDITQPTRIHHDVDSVTGEALVADTGGTEPERLKKVYPHSWLITGQPYEYTLHPTPTLPQQLIQRFISAVNQADVDGGKDLLGICHVSGGKGNKVSIERTEGRKNIGQRVQDDTARLNDTIPTRWRPDLSNPGTPARDICECVVLGRLHVVTGC